MVRRRRGAHLAWLPYSPATMSETSKKFICIDPDAISKHFDAPSAEARWDSFWQEQGTYRYDPSRPREENFVIDTPPLTGMWWSAARSGSS